MHKTNSEPVDRKKQQLKIDFDSQDQNQADRTKPCSLVKNANINCGKTVHIKSHHKVGGQSHRDSYLWQ